MKEVTLQIIGIKIGKDEKEEERLEFVTEGQFFKEGGSSYVVYQESEVSGMPGFKTSLKLSDDEVIMRRFSESEMSDTEIQFQKGRRFEGMYETPFGSLQMEVLTNKLDYKISDEGTGYVDIDYNISLRGLTEGRTKLSIKILEREV